MKKLILVSIIFLGLAASNANAQKYSENKLKYDPRMYTQQYGDPYNPALSGVCSLIMPGLGQIISGEVGRGLGFLGGYAACGAVCMVGLVSATISGINENIYPYGSGYVYTSVPKAGGGLILVGMLGMVAVDIWSIVDAVNVAKVNNMYIQSLRKSSSVNIEVAPFTSQISVNNKIETPVGLSLRVTF